MNVSNQLTDEAILAEMGNRMARCRLDRQLTQADLAAQAGVSKRTVERIEAGDSVQMSTVIRILRVLDLLQGVDRLVPEPGLRPMDLLKLKGRERKRASVPRKAKQSGKAWTWGDDA